MLNEIGFVNFLCRTTEDVKLKDLFPVRSRCDMTEISEIPAGTDIYIEVTSMSDDHAITMKDGKGLTAVDTKVRFFERLFTETRLTYISAIDGKHSNKLVLFVYNGADFSELKDAFKSTKFSSFVVHLPMSDCINWENVQIKELMALLISRGIPVPDESSDAEQSEVDSVDK